uniref:CBS domain-containing protein n=1 Tax=Solanum tuberosum TaxID=4113 RepID=M1D869_SOLTU
GLTGERTVKRLRLSKDITVPDSTSIYDACRRMAARRVDVLLLTDSNALLCGVENGEVIALLDIAKCLYDAVARLERAAKKGKAIVDVVEGVEKIWGASVSGTLTQVSLTSTINIAQVLFHVTDMPIIPKFKRKIEELEFKKKQQETNAIETSRKAIPSVDKFLNLVSKLEEKYTAITRFTRVIR